MGGARGCLRLHPIFVPLFYEAVKLKIALPHSRPADSHEINVHM